MPAWLHTTFSTWIDCNDVIVRDDGLRIAVPPRMLLGIAARFDDGLEIKVARAAVTAGLPEPVRQHPLTLADGIVIHLDLAWPDIMLGFEPGHSWWHGGDLGQRVDQQRRRACAAVGWQVESYDESAAGNLPSVGAEIAAIYHQRRRLLRRS
jgi:hypothetical protein